MIERKARAGNKRRGGKAASLGLAACVGLAIAGFSFGAPAQQATQVLKLGSIGTTSGPNAPMGKEGLSGLEYGVRKVNAAGGVKIGGDSYTVQLVNLDDQS